VEFNLAFCGCELPCQANCRISAHPTILVSDAFELAQHGQVSNRRKTGNSKNPSVVSRKMQSEKSATRSTTCGNSFRIRVAHYQLSVHGLCCRQYISKGEVYPKVSNRVGSLSTKCQQRHKYLFRFFGSLLVIFKNIYSNNTKDNYRYQETNNLTRCFYPIK